MRKPHRVKVVSDLEYLLSSLKSVDDSYSSRIRTLRSTHTGTLLSVTVNHPQRMMSTCYVQADSTYRPVNGTN